MRSYAGWHRGKLGCPVGVDGRWLRRWVDEFVDRFLCRFGRVCARCRHVTGYACLQGRRGYRRHDVLAKCRAGKAGHIAGEARAEKGIQAKPAISITHCFGGTCQSVYACLTDPRIGMAQKTGDVRRKFPQHDRAPYLDQHSKRMQSTCLDMRVLVAESLDHQRVQVCVDIHERGHRHDGLEQRHAQLRIVLVEIGEHVRQ